MASLAPGQTTGKWKVVGWNDLGMHCLDGKDFSVFSLLPPYNNIRAQVIDSYGHLVQSGSGVTVTYQAYNNAGAINTTSMLPFKTNFWTYAQPLFNLKSPLAPDMGLMGFAMPGPKNTPKPMKFDGAANQFAAEGIPITPYDDSGVKNYYPMMRLTARSSNGKALATTDIVLPVSDEMNCSLCHLAGPTNTIKPVTGYVYVADKNQEYRLNILKLHDERRDPATYPALLAQAGYKTSGLYPTASGGMPVLCARCHLSNALVAGGVTGISGVPPLTRSLHSKHAWALDPINGNLPLNSIDNRSACYRCHPGSQTQCLRGAMGSAVAADGVTQLMQCQSCHGSMTAVGASNRQGWLNEPSCQNCHTGTATQNNGQIRYTSVFEPSGQIRVAVNQTFATNPNVPLPGTSLYKLSKGHGGLQCEACHGSTHAEYPSSHPNDNIQSVELQGHTGTLIECASCHGTSPQTVAGGPHGMHPVGQTWVGGHESAAKTNVQQCRNCHGLDYRGTVLSRTATNRTFSTGDFGTKSFPAKTVIGCYSCHNGPNGG